MRTRTLKELFEQVLIGEKAQDYLLRMLEGDRFYRSFWKGRFRGKFGYFKSPDGQGWVAFDNRESDCVVQHFESKTDAVEALMHGLRCKYQLW
jgi:hypothetical protein